MSNYTDYANEHMEKSLSVLQQNFAKVRTGRANPHVLDEIVVDYYGQETPIAQLAGIKVSEGSTLVVEPWDKSALNAVEKAIEESDLGITPNNDGSAIRLPFPRPTEERRRELAKDVRALGEEARVSVRKVRRDANGKIERDEEFTEDEITREKAAIQKITDSFIAKIDEAVKAKEAEVMEI